MKSLRLSVLAVSLTAALASPGMAQINTQPAAGVKTHAFVWDSVNGMQDIGTLGGKISYGLAVNDSGTVVGYSYLRDNVTIHAFMWTAAEGMVDTGKYFPGTSSSTATFINSSGNVCGEAVLTDGKQVPSALLGRRWHNLAESSGNQKNYSFGINDANQVTGQRYYGEVVHAFLWDTAARTLTYLPTLPGGLHTVGTAINNLGHVTGTGSVPPAGYDALFWTAATGSQDIGTLAGSAYTAGQGINDNDEVVGLNSPELGGFYWTAATGIVSLQTLGGSMSPAFGINNSGMITGYSTTAGGVTHATLWTNYLAAPTDLGTLPGGTNSYGRGLNNTGMVVGYADVP